MATFHSEGLTATGTPGEAPGPVIDITLAPDAAEAAAIGGALTCLLGRDSVPSSVGGTNRWSQAGRLEACGLSAPAGIRVDWRH